MAKLNTHVHAVEVNEDGSHGRSGTFGPNDKVPDWAVSAISNPDVWESEPERTEAPSVEVKEPPRGGPGSSATAWHEFVVSQNLDVPDNASTAKDFQAIWDARS